MVGLGPGIFCSVGGRDDHYAMPPGHAITYFSYKNTNNSH
jgi:hypothetical protein